MIKQFQIERETQTDMMDDHDITFSETHENFVNRVTNEINSLKGMKKLISVNYVVLSTGKYSQREVAVITYKSM